LRVVKAGDGKPASGNMSLLETLWIVGAVIAAGSALVLWATMRVGSASEEKLE